MFDVFGRNVAPEFREQYLQNLAKFSFARSNTSSAQQPTSSVQPSATLSQSLAFRPYTDPEFKWIVCLITGPAAERVVEFLNERNIPAGLLAGYPAVKDEEELNLAKIALSSR